MWDDGGAQRMDDTLHPPMATRRNLRVAIQNWMPDRRSPGAPPGGLAPKSAYFRLRFNPIGLEAYAFAWPELCGGLEAALAELASVRADGLRERLT